MTEGPLGAAFFHFDTDVEAVVERVTAGLTEVETVLASAGRGGAVSTGLYDSLNRELIQIQERAAQTAAAIRASFAEAAGGGGAFVSPTGRSLAAELTEVRAQAAQLQASVITSVRDKAPGLIDYRPLARQARLGLTQAIEAEFAGARGDIVGAGARLGRGTPGIGRLGELPAAAYDLPNTRFTNSSGAIIRSRVVTAALGARPSLGEDIDANGKVIPGSYFAGQLDKVTNGGKLTGAKAEFALNNWVATLTKEVESGAKLAAAQDLAAKLLAAEGAGVRRVNASTFLDEGGVVGQAGQYYKASPASDTARLATQTEQSGLVNQASIREAEAERRALEAERRSQTLLSKGAPLSAGQSFLGGVTQRGFFNSGQGIDASLSGIAGTLGTLVKYGVLGGIVGGALFGAGDTLREAKDYADSLVDLQNALRGYTDETGQANDVSIAYVGTLSEISRVSGANVGSALDAAARSIRSFGDEVNNLPKSDRAQALRDIGEAGAEAATKLSVISGKDLRDATGDIVAVGQAYHLQANQLNEINDAVANARNLGGDPKEIGQGLANFAEAAQLAGYNLNEAASVLSLVIAKTDESGQAAATRLSRVFQILRGAGAQGVLEGIGVNTSATLKSQIEQVAQYVSLPTTTDQQRAALTARLGGTANLREFEPLISDQPRLLKNYEDALNHAGQGTEYFNRQIDSLAGLLKRIAGDWKNVQVELVQSNIFAPIGIALKVLEPALHTLSELLNLYDRLPSVLKTGIALTLEFALAAKLLASVHQKQASAALEAAVAEGRLTAAQAAAARSAGAEAVAEATGTTAKAGRLGFTPFWQIPGRLRAAGNAEATALTETQGAAASAAIAAQTAPSLEAGALAAQTTGVDASIAERVVAGAGGATFRTALTAAGGFLLGGGQLLKSLALKLLGPVGLAISGLIAIFSIKGVIDKLHQANKEGAAGLDTLQSASTSDQFAAAASQLGTAAKDNRHATSGLFGSLVSLFTGDDRAKQFEQKAKEAAAEAKALSDEQAQFAQRSSASVFGADAVKTVDDIANGLDKMTRAGVNARDQLTALTDVLGLIGDQNKKPTPPPVPPRQFVDSVIAQFTALGSKAAGSGNSYVLSSTPPLGARGDIPAYGPGSAVPTTPQGQLKYYQSQYRLAQPGVSAKDAFLNTNDSATLRTALLGAVDQLHLQPGQGLSPEMQKKIVDVAIANLKASGVTFDNPAEIFTAVSKGLKDWLSGQQSKALNSVQGPLSAQDITTDLLGDPDKKTAGLLAQQQAALQSIPASDLGGLRLRLLRSNLAALKRLASRSEDGKIPGVLVDAISSSQDAIVQATNDNLEKLRVIAASNAKTVDAAKKINARFYFQEAFGKGATFNSKTGIDSSQPGAVDDPAQMAALIANLAADDVATIKHEIDANAAIKKAALKAAQERLAEWNALPAKIRELNPDVTAELVNAINDAQGAYGTATGQQDNFKAASKVASPKLTSEQLAALRQSANAAPGDSVAQAAAGLASAKADLDASKGDEQKYLQALKAWHEAQHSYDQAVADQKSALDAYKAAQSYGPLADAAAAVQQAKDQVDATTAGTAEYYRAETAYLNAIRQQAAAERQYHANLELLGGDISDPVFQAKVRLDTARRQLRYDRSNGADNSQITQDQLDVRQARLDKEGAKFSQRLSDMQTADELGRISHEKYIQYLDHEHDRLVAIKNRNRQQQDELDQVDQALKSANDQMTGQWNIGSIKIPTPYEVKRAIKAMSAGVDYLGYKGSVGTGSSIDQSIANGTPINHNTTTNHVQINGADFRKVVEYIQSILGKQVTTRGGTRPRKA